MKRVWKIVLAAALAAAMLAGLALPVMAADKPATSNTAPESNGSRVIKGVVVNTDNVQGTFTVKTGQGSIEIRTNPATKYVKIHLPWQTIARALVERAKENLPALKAARAKINPEAANMAAGFEGKWEWLRRNAREASFADIAKGDRVAVWVAANEDKPLAKLVIIVKAPQLKKISGNVTAVNEAGKTFSLNATAQLVHYDNQTVFVLKGTPSLKVGMKALVLYIEDSGNILTRRVVATVPQP